MKARLKTFLLSSLGSIALFSAVTYTSCNNDPCKAIVCAAGGVCNDGDCICASGYEGNQCETETRQKFEGIWYVTEDGTISTTAQYTISVEGNAEPGKISELKISNFRNSFTQPVSAYVKADTLYIPQQTINNNTVQGIGYIGDDPFYGLHGIINLRYSVKNAGNVTDDFGLGAGEPSVWNK
jgi:hypothetical protein